MSRKSERNFQVTGRWARLSALFFSGSLAACGSAGPAAAHVALQAINAPVTWGAVETTSPTGTKPYFGQLHAHSDLSDGRGSPEAAFRTARDEAHLDFFALTDHGEYLDATRWQEIGDQARRYSQPGTFVGLRGFEFTNPTKGHIVVLNATAPVGFVGAAEGDQETLHAWLREHPEALLIMAHPGQKDPIGEEFNHFRLDTAFEKQTVGVEVPPGWNPEWQGGYADRLKGFSFLHQALLSGWNVAYSQGEDNHHERWGLETTKRIGVMLPELTEAALIDALTARHTFVTTSKRLWADLKLDSPAGSCQDDVTGRIDFGNREGREITTVRILDFGRVLSTLDAVLPAGTDHSVTFRIAQAGHELDTILKIVPGGFTPRTSLYSAQVDLHDGTGAVTTPLRFVHVPCGTTP